MFFYKKIIAVDDKGLEDLLEMLIPEDRRLGREIIAILQGMDLGCFGFVKLPLALSKEKFMAMAPFINAVLHRISKNRRPAEDRGDKFLPSGSKLVAELLELLPEGEQLQGEEMIQELLKQRLSGVEKLQLSVVIPKDRYLVFDNFMRKALRKIGAIKISAEDGKPEVWN